MKGVSKGRLKSNSAGAWAGACVQSGTLTFLRVKTVTGASL